MSMLQTTMIKVLVTSHQLHGAPPCQCHKLNILLHVFLIVSDDCVVADANARILARAPCLTRANAPATRRRSSACHGRTTASYAQPQARTQPFKSNTKMTTAATVDKKVDGEVDEVHELKQFLPREFAASSLDAAADQVVDDRLDSEHVRGKVEQDGEAAENEQHPRCTELRVTAREAGDWVLLLLLLGDDARADLLQHGRRHR